MSKRDNLSDYLTDLYQGIKSKKPDASRNPQDFRGEIEQIETKSPEWDGSYETSPDTDIVEGGGSCEEAILIPKTATENKTYYASDDGADGYSEFTVAVPIPETPEVTSEERTVTPTKSVQEITPINADYLSKVTVEAIPDEYEEVPVWDGDSLFAKSGTHTFVDNPAVFEGVDTILDSGLFTIKGNVPDVGEVEATCDAIYRSDGANCLMYRVISTTPDLTDLGFTYPTNLMAYDWTAGTWYDPSLKTVEFEEYAIMSSYDAYVWFNENTNPVGVVSEPIAAFLGGDEELLLRSGDGVLFLTEGKKIDRDYAIETRLVEASAPACDRPLGFWFMTADDQYISYNTYEDEDGNWVDEPIYTGIKDSITLPPQVQDGSATSFTNLFAHMVYDDAWGSREARGVWAKEITGTLNCASVTALPYLFYGCDFTEKIGDIVNTENVTQFQGMFDGCFRLASIPTIDMRSATSTSNMFSGCVSLKSLDLKNVKVSLVLTSSPYLDVDSLVGLCAELVPPETSQTLTIGDTNLNKIKDIKVKVTDENDPKKPFVISTDDDAISLKDEYVPGKGWTIK